MKPDPKSATILNIAKGLPKDKQDQRGEIDAGQLYNYMVDLVNFEQLHQQSNKTEKGPRRIASLEDLVVRPSANPTEPPEHNCDSTSQ